FAALDDALARAVESAGLDSDAPHAFRIEGPVRDLQWHVIDGARLEPGPSSHAAHQAAAERGELAAGDALLIGFRSRRHHGVFTHHGSDTHVHVVLREPGITGHVDRVDLPAGTVVLLPAPGADARAAERAP